MTAIDTSLPAQLAAPTRWQRLKYELRRNWLAYALLAPLIILLLAFLLLPFISLFYYGFQRVELNGETTFAGLRNFRILLGEERFKQNLTNTLIYLFGNLAISVPLAYFAALLISSNRRGVGVLRTLFLIPWVLAPIVTAVLFKTMMNPSSGPITLAFNEIFGQPIYLTLTEGGARLLIVLHAAWRSFPLMMLLIAAGITAIPLELYEAARVDGAGMWQQFRFITLPLTRLALFSAVLLISVYTIQDAEGVYALTQGGPGYGTEVTGVRLFKEAFLYFNIGLASAIGIVLITMSVLLIVFYLRLLGSGEQA
jgi:multiple sugar transport system permease protein